MLACAFHLTDAETQVLMAFLDGASLRDIAAERGRSLTTVRTQLQTVMSKMGVQTQAELMRNAFAISQFLGEVDDIAEAATHPHRRRINLLRPGGRAIELVLSGDLSGQAVVFLPDVTLFTFQASVEARFEAAGLCIISLCRPGSGASSPPLSGETYEDCLAGDILAVLDQLGIKRAKLMAHSLSSAIACRMGALIRERITEIIITAALIPRPFLEASNMNSPWASALHAAMDQSPKLFALMVGAGVRAWKVLGTRRFVALQLGRYAPDVALAARPETDIEFIAAMSMTVKQGNDALSNDLQTSMGDWSAWVRDCQVPITLIHGQNDPGANITDVRDFADAFDGRINLIELDDAGFMTFLSHPHVVLGSLGADTAERSSCQFI
jgi:pimeloyl-ACP methyl ester carboxylesterase/DNA-binding CsgD family transcriptional regulator